MSRVLFFVDRALGTIQPAAAERLVELGAGYMYSTPQEMRQSKVGDYQHGQIEECGCAGTRIWNDQMGAWLNTYATVRFDADDARMREAVETLAEQYAIGTSPQTGVLAASVHVTASDGSVYEIKRSRARLAEQEG
jgi:hypothetical protein